MLTDALRLASLGWIRFASLENLLNDSDNEPFHNAQRFWDLIAPDPSGGIVERLVQLSSIMTMASCKITSEPRDRIYAVNELCAMVPRSYIDHSLVVPDYQKPVQEVFRDATKALLEMSGDWVLTGIDEDPTRTNSWVNDWTKS